MNLTSVYPATVNNLQILYELLKERDLDLSISHKEMPSVPEHEEFVDSIPYQAWYFIVYNDMILGAIYLSKQREIGIQLFKQFQGKGYGKKAVQMLIDKHPGEFLWNVNPKNEPSIKLIESLGGKLIQWTYKIGNSS